MEDLRYPIGRFVNPDVITEALILQWIGEIEKHPERLREAVATLDDEQLQTPYRDGGWTIRQVVHHLADGHMNSYIRFKLALTEDEPTIKSYQEDRWALLSDTKDAPIELSLGLLKHIVGRWVILLRSMSVEQFNRNFRHPEYGVMTLAVALGSYAWHGNHHIAHITSLKQVKGWK